MRRWAGGLVLGLLVAGCVRGGYERPARDQASDLAASERSDRRVERPERGLGDASSDGDTFRPGTIVPLYMDPDQGSAWTELAGTKALHPTVPVIAIANRLNGPGASSSLTYFAGIASLVAVGVQVIGYVRTNYGQRDVLDVRADIERWSSWYRLAGLSGVFLDQQAAKAGLESYYSGLASHARGLGLTLIVGNPGTDPAPSYVGTVDTLVIHNGAGLPPLTSLDGWHLAHPRRNFGILCYGVENLDPSFVANAVKRVGYLYVTSDTSPDPWNTLSPQLGALLAALGS